MNLHFTPFNVRYSFNLGERNNFLISFEADLNVFALSLIIVAGKPLRAQKRRNARINASTVRFSTNSKCTARVEAHVNKQT